MDVLGRVDVTLKAATDSWTETGLVLGAGESLHFVARGVVAYGKERGHPEGSYDSTALDHAEDVGATVSYAQAGGGFPVTNTAPFSIAIYIGNTAPNFGANAVSNALRGRRDTTFPSGPSGKVWLLFNDKVGAYGNNSGEFSVTLERLGVAPPPALNPGQVSPIRFIPNPLMEIKARTVQDSVVCWFVQPKHGPAEGYTEWDAPIVCPQYIDATGADDAGNPLYSTIPALTYKPFSGLDITSVPTSIKLGVDAPDIEIVRFDLRKLRREYYEEAFVEVFEVPLDQTARFAPSGTTGRSNRIIYLTGTLGNAQGVDGDESGYGSATIELTPFEELLNIPIGGTICQICDVGRLPGETFGRGRCRNQVMLDGPNIELLTRGAVVAAVVAPSKLLLTPEDAAGYAGYNTAFPASHGILQFRGGELDGLRRDIGTFDAATGEIILRRALPFPPGVGDLLTLEAGCDHTFDGPRGCGFWNNRSNFRGFPYVPGRAALTRRTKT